MTNTSTTLAIATAALVAIGTQIATLNHAFAGTTETQCATQFGYKWLPPHKAGDINPKSNGAYKRASSGACRIDMAVVKTLLAAQAKTPAGAPKQ